LIAPNLIFFEEIFNASWVLSTSVEDDIAKRVILESIFFFKFNYKFILSSFNGAGEGN
jgi:hypothetical protein